MATLEERLKEARSAYHALMTGQLARVFVDQNGERVEFTSANKTSLYNYILQLEMQTGSIKPRDFSPIGFIF